ncbi:hypothetical protein C5468_25360 [Photorhabdus luminescens subsp. mexicana]|uniref:Uncharacterized protein n=2 Tax=Photorhabdus luminescens TaxID=29488 RepID=A0A4R4INA0_PHOLU|nr:hypothetical protein C5468_25360 [Photorhabdus luminescens subsp. mexicana]
MKNDKYECAKRKCKHIHYDRERVYIKDPECSYAKISTCPKCGHNEFYILNRREVKRIEYTVCTDTGERFEFEIPSSFNLNFLAEECAEDYFHLQDSENWPKEFHIWVDDAFFGIFEVHAEVSFSAKKIDDK